MSDAQTGTSAPTGMPVPRQESGSRSRTGSAPSGSPGARAAYGGPEPTGWVGWITFAGAMMIFLGMFHAIQGLVAVFQDDYFLVGTSGLVVQFDFTVWGWTHMALGAVVMATGAGMLFGQTWARVGGVVLAFASALVNIGFLAAYPIWSTIMITLDVIVIWALTVHGAEMRSLQQQEASFR